MRTALRWLTVLLLAGVSLLIGARAQAAAQPMGGQQPAEGRATASTVAPTEPSTTTTTSPAGGRSLYTVAFLPCTSDGTQDGSEPCDETPASIQVSYSGTPPDQVEVDWATSGRSAAAPEPGATSVTLCKEPGYGCANPAPASSCGTDLICWPWPAVMEDKSFILNGTYQLTVCPLGDSGQGTCNNPVAQQSVGLAVPPGMPTAVSASTAGREVTVRWDPPAQSPPDLVGYTVTRDNDVIYTCSTDDLGPGQGTPCPAGLEVSDHPGDGEYVYAVTALRLGVDDATANVVSSSAAVDGQGVVTVPAPADQGQGGSPTAEGDGSPGLGTPVPVSYDQSGGGSSVNPVPAAITGTAVTLAPTVTSAPAPGAASPPVPKLSYPTSSDVAPAHPQALELKVDPPTSHEDVVPVAVLALGILSLAVAAHFLYLRVELGVVQARLAARRTTGV